MAGLIPLFQMDLLFAFASLDPPAYDLIGSRSYDQMKQTVQAIIDPITSIYSER